MVQIRVEINQCVGCTENSSLSHFSAMTNRHRHAIEQAPRRWRGGRDDSAQGDGRRRQSFFAVVAGRVRGAAAVRDLAEDAPARRVDGVDDLLPFGRLRVVGDAGLAVERDRVVGDARELRDDETGRRALDVILLHQVVRQVRAEVRAATRERRLRV